MPEPYSTKPLFSFAVITDSHINQDEAECNSPFEVNKLANRRLRHIVNDLNSRELTAVFHLGDVVHPVPSMGELYTDSANQFFDQMNHLRHPFHMIPGNHDVGDKKIDWGPAGTIRPDFIEAWQQHFGDDHFHVTYNDIEFIGINAQLLGSGLAEETEQKSWLESTCESLAGKRLFLLTHYPPFLENEEESEHYDNLAPEARTWMLNILSRYEFEGLFAGHVHHFWYNQIEDCQCYLLPATSFVRQDYSEMFRVGPADELGRNDAPKLGYFLVHVYPDRHDFEMVRSFGAEVDADIGISQSVAEKRTLKSVNARTNRAPNFGFDLRQDWMERVQIPPSGGLDEFDRKWVRNDYGLLALWEMGIKRLRIPLQDLAIAKRRQRIQVMIKLGFSFDGYHFGVGSNKDFTSLLEHVDLLDNVEMIWPLARLDELNISSLEKLIDGKCGIRISPLRSKHEILATGKKYYHVINHGLTLNDLHQQQTPQIPESIENLNGGWCFRASMEDDIIELLDAIKVFDTKHATKSVMHLRMAPDNPASQLHNDDYCEQRITKAIFYSWAISGAEIYCDALTDNDRGYFPRVGVLDRLFNPKPAWNLIKNSHAALSELPLGTKVNKIIKQSEGAIIETDAFRVQLHIGAARLPLSGFDNIWDLYSGNPWDESTLLRGWIGVSYH
ncbi:MAG: putative phosphodiesterase [Parasphingorhabdus sp.]|jgi:predicted phosphodiesterase